MMKKVVFYFLFLELAFFHWNCLKAQTPVSIQWKQTYDTSAVTTDTILQFEGAFLSVDQPRTPILILTFQSDLSRFNIQNVNYQALTKSETALIENEILQDSIFYEIKKGQKNHRIVSNVWITPIRRNKTTHQIEKIVSFNYSTKVQFRKTASAFRAAANHVESSVLAQGDWYKLQITSSPTATGSNLYKIDYDLLKSIIGNNIDNTNPQNIKLYGNGGGMLPEPNASFKYDDLQENAVYIVGEEDGKFDKTDYILFYGKGPDGWNYDTSKKIFHHVKNIYSDNTYYFLTIGDTNGKRISIGSDTGSISQVVNSYPERLFYEKDDYNLLQSGRVWYSDKFETSSKKDINFNIDGFRSGTSLSLSYSLMAQSLSSSSFDLYLNGAKFTNIGIPASSGDYGAKGVEVTRTSSINTISSTSLSVTFGYNKSSNASIGFLNYCEVNYQSDLTLKGNKTFFRSLPGTGALAQFQISNVNSNTTVWDITNPILPIQKSLNINGTDGSFTSTTEVIKEFIVFSGSDFDKPQYVGKVANQDLHAIATGDLPDLIIVTDKSLVNSAQKLADFRNTNDGLKVAVATTEQIYNEFSSGAQDLVAIRNFVKMFYDKSNASDSISYLLFFGSGSYDYKNRVKNNTNLVPIYETPESLNDIVSQSSDDYCGFLDDSEGDWEKSSIIHYLDVGIGRLPVRNSQEADDVVNKLIYYSTSSKSYGSWRNRACLVADNKDPNFIHLNDAEVMAGQLNELNPSMNVTKLYMDAFPLISAPGGQICPDIKDALLKELNKGTFIVNYSGHGSEFIWAQENILQMNDIINLQNKDALPFFITATCEFGRYDDPAKTSGAMNLVLNPGGGGIGILTSTRPVYAYSNVTINKAFYSEVFDFSGGQKPKLGYIMMNTKNNSIIGYNNRNYSLLGDPSLTLSYPQEQITLTAFNNQNASGKGDTLNALSKVYIQGNIGENGKKDPNFNGIVNITIFDKPTTVVTDASTFQVQNNIVFDGSASVKNGDFSLSFIVSKDISYNFGEGKISFYSKDSSLHDAHGYYDDVIIGGSSKNALLDTIPPTIKLFIGDKSFVNGGLAASNTTIIAEISDSSGVNISNAGIGHEIIGILNESKDVIVMNDFYTSEQDNYKTGNVNYPISNLEPGKYTIMLKAWDTYNNSSTSSIDFIVPDKQGLYVTRVENYPNPFSESTTISFEHNRSGFDLDISAEIFSISGDLVNTIESKILGSPTRVTSFGWDGRNVQGSPVSPGMYIGRIKVSDSDGESVVKNIKMILIK